MGTRIHRPFLRSTWARRGFLLFPTLFLAGLAGQTLAEAPRPQRFTAPPTVERPLAEASTAGLVASSEAPLRGAAPTARPWLVAVTPPTWVLPAGSDNLVVDYTVADGSSPGQRFRYRLEGFDDTWTDAGATRQAVYPRPLPGRYRFRVQALDATGTPVSETSLWVEVESHLLHTPWFRGLLVLLLVFGGLIAHGLWLAAVQRREHDLAVRVSEAMDRFKTLEGLLTICATCKSVRDGGEWTTLETYLSQHTEIELSHGYCPTCLEAEFPEVAHRMACRSRQETGLLTH